MQFSASAATSFELCHSQKLPGSHEATVSDAEEGVHGNFEFGLEACSYG